MDDEDKVLEFRKNLVEKINRLKGCAQYELDKYSFSIADKVEKKKDVTEDLMMRKYYKGEMDAYNAVLYVL
jgi:hypothetical protein